MKLIVGLGNPGEKYENTRHNTGFLAMDKLADTLNVRIRRKAFSALIEKINVGGEQVVLMKPQTYMNHSGEAVGKAVRYYHLDPERDILVIYDDLDLPAGKIRLREKGSAGVITASRASLPISILIPSAASEWASAVKTNMIPSTLSWETAAARKESCGWKPLREPARPQESL